ncbi:helix-turn-helix transcriptional regulator [Haloechinothrix sp. YIM 98757]|uniref:Helix-turn-helix transcriptional regulator n=1 Tax=Haloechinothrix aidingensis TaxID=2752311 RepID=A0A838ADT7_9PSEU|nr:helix-turn-helix transcriptional regulator [Haloechinothrix aidingensis]
MIRVSTKRYGQFCGLARALDLVGDRWSLLIVRELLVGPARYSDLRAGLPGIATNLLARRLRELEGHGVLERRLSPDAVVYALTDFGHGLREPVEALVRWSTPLMAAGRGDDAFHASWLLVALRALLRRPASGGPACVEIEVDGEVITIHAATDELSVTLGPSAAAQARLASDAATVLGLAAGHVRVADAIRTARHFEGAPEALETIFGRA